MRTFRCSLYGIYGLTESTGGVVQLDPEDHDPDGPREYLLRSAGRPLPWVELRVADPVTGEELGSGEIGEVWLRAPNVMAGYHHRPEETAAAITPDGWLRTGDGGYIDDAGYLFLTDRIKDMIVTGGENVYPVEVEEALSQHPDVVEVAVIGVPDEQWGELVTALVVPREGTTPASSGWSNSPDHDSLATSFPVRSSSSTSCHEHRLERCSNGSCVTGARNTRSRSIRTPADRSAA